MEQKKTLWIIAAVGAFLLVVIGAAAIVYSPAKNPTPTMASVSPVAKTSAVANTGWITPPADSNSQPVAIPQDTAYTNDVVVLANNATVYEMPKTDSKSGTTIDLNSLKYETPVEVPSQNINITVNIPEAETKTETKVETPAVTTKPVQTSAPAKKTSASTSTPAAKVTTTTTTSSKATVKVETKVEPKKVTQFWVQVAAYSNKKGAEGARSVLDSNKIPADIFTYKDNKGTLYYRVRVGPYTTKSEAEYWRTRIIKIDEFSKAESYVTSTTN